SPRQGGRRHDRSLNFYTSTNARRCLMRRHTQVWFLVIVGYGLFVAVIVGSWPLTVFAQSSCSIAQITNTTTGSSDNNSLSADGARIGFVASAKLTGGNADGNFESFLFDITTTTFTQITSTTGAGTSTDLTSLSPNGTRIAFHSNANLTGGNADG